jgi:RNA polymerase sigma-70 factor (subfamily 1)
MPNPLSPQPDDRSLDRAEQVLALQRLVHTHASELAAYVGRMTPPDLKRLVDPQDVVQDTYFEAFQRLGQFTADNADAALRWLKTIARHRLTDVMRKHNAAKRDHRRTTEQVTHGSVVDLLHELAVYRRTPSKSAVARELLRTLESSIDRLSTDYRHVVNYRYIDGLSYKEAGERMNRTEDATRMLAGRALQALRVEMGSESRFF